MHRHVILLAATAALASPAFAQHWGQFRGPDGSGTSASERLPVEWSDTKNVAWKTEIPGRAWSCPILVKEKVFVTTAASSTPLEPAKKGLYFGGNRPEPRGGSHQWLLLCLDADTGKPLWSRVCREGEPKTAIHLKNTYASETPATDGERIYAYFGSAGLYCYDLRGELLWSKDLGGYETRFGWGTASSPIVDDQRVYIQCDNETQSFVTALDKLTGEEVWRAEREEGSSWSTPFLWNNDQRTELVTCATNRVRSYDPKTGMLLWELGGMSSIVCPTPIAAHGLLYVSSGYVLDDKKPLFAVRPGATGEIPLNDNAGGAIAWVQKQAGPYNPSPIVVGDYLYVLYDRGFFACFDAKSGAPVYTKKRLSGEFTASPWAYRDRIFCLNEDGDAYVIQAGPEFAVLGKNSIQQMCMATPALGEDSLFLRTATHLFRLREE